FSLTRGTGPLYRIIPVDQSPASSFVCNDAHILVLKISGYPCATHCPSTKSHKPHQIVQWFEHVPATNKIKNKSRRFYYGPDQAHQTADDALAAANAFIEDGIPNDASRERFLWQPTVSQFLSAPKAVQRHCKMFIPGRIRFPDREGFLRTTL